MSGKGKIKTGSRRQRRRRAQPSSSPRCARGELIGGLGHMWLECDCNGEGGLRGLLEQQDAVGTSLARWGYSGYSQGRVVAACEAQSRLAGRLGPEHRRDRLRPRHIGGNSRWSAPEGSSDGCHAPAPCVWPRSLVVWCLFGTIPDRSMLAILPLRAIYRKYASLCRVPGQNE